MLETRVLGVRLDPLEASLLAGARNLELGDEDRRLAGRGLRERDRTLVREEPEAREVLDVRLIEEHVPARAARADLLEQSFAPLLELSGGYAGGGDGVGARHLPILITQRTRPGSREHVDRIDLDGSIGCTWSPPILVAWRNKGLA